MLTKGAIGNLINRYKAVLTKCNLINTFGSLAVASMLVLGGAGVAEAEEYDNITPPSQTSYTGDTFKNFTNSTTQGGVFNLTSSTQFENVIFDTNIVTTGTSEGGAIHNAADLTITKSTFTNNQVKTGLATGGAIEHASGTLIVTGDEDKKSYFKGNVALRRGGAINVAGGTAKVEYSIFEENQCGMGGVFYNSSVLEVKNCEFYGNTAGDGAVLYQNSKGSATFTNCTFIGNTATANGGVFAVEGEEVETPSVNLEGNNLFQNNTAAKGGGAIYVYNAETPLSVVFKEGSVNTFINNTVDGKKNDIHNDYKIVVESGAVISLDGGITSTNTGTEDEPEYTGTITGEGSIEFTSTETKVQAKSIDKTVKAVASEALNDQLGGDLDAFKEQIGNKFEAKNIVMKAGMTAPGYENGKFSKNEVMDAVLQQASITMVSLDKILTNDVRKRLGDIRSDANTTGVWMRWDGGKMKGDSGLTNNFNTIQIGGDTKAAKNCRIGFAGSFTHGDMDFNLGGGELEGFSFALYGTWMGENGMFADVVARLGKFSTEMTGNGRKGDMDNRVASLSGEYGWRLPVCDQFFVEPQVELAYTYVSSDDLQLGEAHYEFDSVDSLTGRAGVVAGWQLPEERGNVYARASVVQQFMGDAKVTGATSGKPVTQERDGEDTWLEYGIGANVKLTDSTYVWADVERTEGAEIEEEWRGTVGVRFSF